MAEHNWSIQINDAVKKSQVLLQKFEEELNLNYLENAINLLAKLANQLPIEEPNKEMLIAEINLITRKYSNIDKWLAGSKCNYQVDIRYQ